MESLYDIIGKINELNLWKEDGTLDKEALSKLDIPLDEKLENLALYIKNEKALAARRQTRENRAERLSEYLLSTMTYLGYSKREYPRAVISTRKSESVETDDEFVRFAQENNLDSFLSYKNPTANKSAIKAALKLGEVIEHVALVEKTNINIK